MFFSIFFIINTNSFQDYIRNNIISYVNSNTDNTIEISDSRYNLKGELIISDVLFSDINSDTIFKLESLSTKYIPLISNNQYYSTLKINGTDKQQVGMVAAEIKSLRPPEPYKGKGIKEQGQYILRKEGKKK